MKRIVVHLKKSIMDSNKTKACFQDFPETKFTLLHHSKINHYYFDKHVLIKTFRREVKIKVPIVVNIGYFLKI